MPRKIEISHRTIIFTVVFVIFLWFLFLIRSILLGLFISLILMSALNPSVRRLEKLKMPRWLAILIIYIIVSAIIAIAIGGIIPPLIEQTSNLINNIPTYLTQFKVMGIDERIVASQLSQFAAIPANIIRFSIGVFSNLVAVLGIAVITFYLLLERQNLNKYLTVLFGEGREKEIEGVIDQIEVRLGGWVRGTLLLMVFVAVLSYIGYKVMGVSYALPLAILMFVLEIVPNIGPTLAALPAIVIGFTISPVLGLAVAGWAFLVQQVQNSILLPRVMEKVAGVNPLVSLLLLATGFKLAGVGGAILAIPVFIAGQVVFQAIFSSKKFGSLNG